MNWGKNEQTTGFSFQNYFSINLSCPCNNTKMIIHILFHSYNNLQGENTPIWVWRPWITTYKTNITLKPKAKSYGVLGCTWNITWIAEVTNYQKVVILTTFLKPVWTFPSAIRVPGSQMKRTLIIPHLARHNVTSTILSGVFTVWN